MKKAFFYVFLVVGLYSCNNGNYDMTPSVDKSNVPNPLNLPIPKSGDVYMVARINGDTVIWKSTSGIGSQPAGGVTMIGTSGISAQKKTIIINIPTYNGVGTYQMNTNANATYVINGDTVNSTFGTLVINNDNHWIKANFSFQGAGVNITEGYVEYERN